MASQGRKAQQAIKRSIPKNPKMTVEVGFFEDASYPDGTKVARVAGQHEFGVPSMGNSRASIL